MAAIVETILGRMRGITSGTVEAFLGIPYAMPPVPPHRFMAPRPPTQWAGVRDVDTFAAQAHQLPFPFLDTALAGDPFYDATRDFHRGVVVGPVSDAEDCLALNVWTPAASGTRPVMVWLHGGGFTSGSGGWGWWTGEDLAANQDVVVVTLNHRLNIFGFLSLAEHGGPAHGIATNCGMRDIVMALEWVRDNIAAFGGDPGNVTIFGQSGGGMKVTTLMAMPAAQGLFHKAIVQSGPFVRAVPMTRASDVAARMLDHLGITRGRLDALQIVSPRVLLDAFASAHEGAPGVPRQFAPAVDGDSLPRDPFEPSAPATASGVTLLIGATGEEITSLQGFSDPSIFDITEAELPALRSYRLRHRSDRSGSADHRLSCRPPGRRAGPAVCCHRLGSAFWLRQHSAGRAPGCAGAGLRLPAAVAKPGARRANGRAAQPRSADGLRPRPGTGRDR